MQVKNKNILVVGFGKSGLASANFLINRGAEVTVTDVTTEQQLKKQIAELCGPVRFSLGDHRDEDFIGADLIILSPGVPTHLPELGKAARAGVPIYSEIELAYRFLPGRIIGVTGSNGKTTTTTLIGELFNHSGRKHVVAGNIGSPLIQFADDLDHTAETTFIVELSSFQLETVSQFKCDIALLLNITPDHLDRYSQFGQYAEAKEQIFLNQTETDYAVLNADSPYTSEMAKRRRSQVLLFSRKQVLVEGIFVKESSIYIRWKGKQHYLMPTSDIGMKGNHNLENILAATAAGFLSHLDPALMAETFRSFSGVEHRLEWVDQQDGVDFYNDSKATNVDSASQALQAFDRPLVVIMGGKDKGGDFTLLRKLVAKKARLLVLLGAASDKIFAALGNSVATVRARDMREAVELARQNAQADDVVLLAPGCASFDMFEDFEHRGRAFKEAIRRIQTRKEPGVGSQKPEANS